MKRLSPYTGRTVPNAQYKSAQIVTSGLYFFLKIWRHMAKELETNDYRNLITRRGVRETAGHLNTNTFA